MPKDNRFNLYIDRAFLQVVKELYTEPRDISMAAAIKAALEDQLTLAGIDWKTAVAQKHVEMSGH